jgi:threonine synthase
MRYISTRGQAPALNFEDVLLAGLATDGGLYVPENLPRFTQEEIASWAGLPYHELAFRVMRPFVTGSIPTPTSRRSSKKPTACLPTAPSRRCVS